MFFEFYYSKVKEAFKGSKTNISCFFNDLFYAFESLMIEKNRGDRTGKIGTRERQKYFKIIEKLPEGLSLEVFYSSLDLTLQNCNFINRIKNLTLMLEDIRFYDNDIKESKDRIKEYSTAVTTLIFDIEKKYTLSSELEMLSIYYGLTDKTKVFYDSIKKQIVEIKKEFERNIYFTEDIRIWAETSYKNLNVFPCLYNFYHRPLIKEYLKKRGNKKTDKKINRRTVKTTVILTMKNKKFLESLKERTGLTFSDIIRRLLDKEQLLENK